MLFSFGTVNDRQDRKCVRSPRTIGREYQKAGEKEGEKDSLGHKLATKWQIDQQQLKYGAGAVDLRPQVSQTHTRRKRQQSRHTSSPKVEQSLSGGVCVWQKSDSWAMPLPNPVQLRMFSEHCS